MNSGTRCVCIFLILWRAVLPSVVSEEYGPGIEDWESSSFPSVSRDQPHYNVLVVSTLNGSLFGVDHSTGDTLWRLDNDPAVRISATSKEGVVPVFFPDPKDGALYILNTAESAALKKLPFSVQQLVASSPCRGTDGIFYSGKKIDSWFSVDVSTGKRTPLFASQNQIDDGQTCPTETVNSIFLGRTEYNLLMFDEIPHKRAWNITFSDYTSNTLPKEQLNNYAYKHVGSISSGRVKTLDRRSGNILWDTDFGSPMVGIYLRRGNGLVNLPFTSTAESMLDSTLALQNDHLQSTLYIDKYHHGLYALPSLVDTSVPVIAENAYPTRLLIGGPDQIETSFAIIPGHYKISPLKSTQLLIGGRTDIIIQPNRTSFNSTRNPARVVQKREEMTQTDPSSLSWNLSVESKILAGIVAVLSLFVVAMFLYILAQVREIKHSSQGSSQGSSSSGSSVSQHGFVTVGKISFDTRDILGKGCEGTFVFRGTFDGRSVAVKRLLPECFTVADREVQLLRESDAHPNVIRYFTTEEDLQFRYIALELCTGTLQDYVEKGKHRNNMTPVDALSQATSGLEHLHALKIVHRDIKPHNILLSTNSTSSQVRVMISDFGLCKKLSNGRASFSKKSGITGTEGWIAPEMMLSSGRVTSSVDIFSMGCVFYFTLSHGKHPFGEPLRRQSNILTEDFKLSALENDDLWRILISKMISKDPCERPSAGTVRIHPVFWPKSQILAFLQDASDRVEKEATDSEVLLELETGGIEACGGDWTKLIDPEVAQDLGKYRSYKGDSIRDLLRALRNKRHHYRELCDRARELLGHSAESYVSYWMSRFPRLLYHTWSSLQFLKVEPSFKHYYDQMFLFPFERSDQVPRWILENGASPGTPLLTSKTLSKQSSPKKRFSRRPPPPAPLQQPQSSPADHSEREAWIKAGTETGAWRPGRGGGGARERRKVRQADEIKENDGKGA